VWCTTGADRQAESGWLSSNEELLVLAAWLADATHTHGLRSTQTDRQAAKLLTVVGLCGVVRDASLVSDGVKRGAAGKQYLAARPAVFVCCLGGGGAGGSKQTWVSSG
jgi:hypothetical protein